MSCLGSSPSPFHGRATRWSLALALGALVLAAGADAEAQRRGRRARTGTLIVESMLDGAEVLVDEETVGFTPLDPLELSVGTHTVRVRRPGYTEFDGVVEIRRRAETRLPVDLIALAMVLTVRSTPEEARVFVDGTFRGTTPIELELVEGEHSLRITSPRHHESIREITARAGETDLLSVELEAIPEELLTPPTPEWYEEPLTWVAVGGGAVVLAVVIIVTAVLTTQGRPLNGFCGESEERCAIVSRPAWTF